MPKKPKTARTAQQLGGRVTAAEVDDWLHRHAETFWNNHVRFRDLAKSDGNKFFHSMRDYYGACVSSVGFLRAQLEQTKGIFNDGTGDTSESGNRLCQGRLPSSLGEESTETSGYTANSCSNCD